MKNLTQQAKRVIEFNRKAGNGLYDAYTLDFDRSIISQAALIREEGLEVEDASQHGDYNHLLKEFCDVFVVVMEGIHRLEKAGFDFEGAMQEVNDNNFLKIYSSYAEAVEVKEALESRDDKEYFINTNYHNGVPFYVVVNEKGKIMKRVNHPAVDLSKYLPKGVTQ